MKINEQTINQLYISDKHKALYQEIIMKKHLKPKQMQHLYLLNFYICCELYPLLNVIETIFRTKLHRKLTESYGTENWFNLIKWESMQLSALQEVAAKKRNIKNPVLLLDDLPLSFWKHLLDSPYIKSIYEPAIVHIFPHYNLKEPLTRSKIKTILEKLVDYRNAVAHCDIVIFEERKLLNSYHAFLQLLYWMDKDYYDMIKKHSQFLKYYRLLLTSSFSLIGYCQYLKRRMRHYVVKCFWIIARKFPNVFHVEE